ncbi:MAG TPA: ATP-binding protein [Candidatus Hydrogenedentes bacterium]|nr:ATP-binding protein [Candidatus Hydrogenedentota bacterium]
MRIRAKMLGGYGFAFALLGVLLVWAIVNLVSLGRATEAILRENYHSIQASEEMLSALRLQDEAIEDCVLGPDAERAQQFREKESTFLQWLSRAKDNITVEGEAENLATLEADYVAFLLAANQLLANALADPSDARAFYRENIRVPLERVSQGCVRLWRLNEEHMFQASSRARRVAHRATWSTLLVGIATLSLGVVASIVFSRRLVKPIGELTRATSLLTEGHYEVRVPTCGGDELGVLADDFNLMAEKLGSFHAMNLERLLGETRKTEAVLRSISDGIMVMDAEFRITSINPAAARLFDVEPDEAMGRHVLEIVRSERLFEHVNRPPESGLPMKQEEDSRILSLERGDEVRHYLYDARHVKGEDGSTVGVVLVFRDITRFQELDRMKSDFVMAASHELRTPLTGIEMNLGLLEESFEYAQSAAPPSQIGLLKAAQEDVVRLKVLVNDLLELTRLEGGRIELQFARVSVRLLCERTLAAFDRQIRSQQVDVSVDVPDEVPEVRADPSKVAWVLSNLVSNALRYVDVGGRIVMSAERAGSWVHVSVADNGKGIPEEFQARVFDKFVRVAEDDSAGTGLGLAICKEILHAHRGLIWVDSVPGKGSTFTFTLPAFDNTLGDGR